MYKRIKATDLAALFPHAKHTWFVYLLLPFTTGNIGCFGYQEMKDYSINLYWRKWFFYLTYPVRVLWVLLYCMWDGGLREFSFPYYSRIYGLFCEWIHTEGTDPVRRTMYEQAKKLWERA